MCRMEGADAAADGQRDTPSLSPSARDGAGLPDADVFPPPATSGLGDIGGAVRRAADAIRSAILRRELGPGMQIRQADLATQLQLSRIPVREALKVVETEGLVVHRPNSGYYVRRLSEAELTELYLMRDLLETEVLSRVGTVSPADVDALVALNLEAEGAVVAGDLHRTIESNRSFHFALLELGGAPIILDEIRRLWSMSESYRVFHLVGDAHQAGTMVQHRKMIDAVRVGDTPSLVRLSKEHREIGQHSVVELLRSGF